MDIEEQPNENKKAEHNIEHKNTECSICMEYLIGPYSLPCGHNLCMGCFIEVRKNQCPICRCVFHNKNNFQINLLLEELLRQFITNYDTLKTQKNNVTTILKFTQQYSKSRRYTLLVRTIKKMLTERQWYIALTELEKIITSSTLNIITTNGAVATSKPSPLTVAELHYVIDRASNVLAVDIGDECYIVYCSSLEFLGPFINHNREYFNKNHGQLCKLFNCAPEFSEIESVIAPCLDGVTGINRTLMDISSEAYLELATRLTASDLVATPQGNMLFALVSNGLTVNETVSDSDYSGDETDESEG